MTQERMIQLLRRGRNILLVFAVFVFSLWRGNAQKKGMPRTIAIYYPTNNIGDMVCITPLFGAIKKKDKQIKILVIGSPKNRSLLADHDMVDGYIESSRSLWSIVSYLWAEKVDSGIAINMDVRSVAALYLGGAKSITCFDLDAEHVQYSSRPFTYVASFVHTVEYTPGKYIPAENLRLLEPFDIHETDATKTLRYSESAKQWVTHMLAEYGVSTDVRVVAIAPGAGSDIKRWPAERFAVVANYISKVHNAFIVIIGSPGDQHAVAEMLSHLKPETQYWNCGPQSLDDLKATLGRATLVIGNDSGAIHVGEAVGAMTLTIAGATDVGEHMREEAHHRIVQSAVGGHVYRSYIGNEDLMDKKLAQEQMDSIAVDEVVRVVDGLLGVK